MGKYMGGYAGSSNVLTSTANQELVPSTLYPGTCHSQKNYFCEFYFYNNADCHIKVNGSGSIYLKAGQNFEMDETNPMISSFIIVDANVSFSWVGVFD